MPIVNMTNLSSLERKNRHGKILVDCDGTGLCALLCSRIYFGLDVGRFYGRIPERDGVVEWIQEIRR